MRSWARCGWSSERAYDYAERLNWLIALGTVRTISHPGQHSQISCIRSSGVYQLTVPCSAIEGISHRTDALTHRSNRCLDAWTANNKRKAVSLYLFYNIIHHSVVLHVLLVRIIRQFTTVATPQLMSRCRALEWTRR